MTTTLQAKQIKKILSANVLLTGLIAGATSGSVDISSELTTALNTAGNGGTAVPLQNSLDQASSGVIIDAPYNRARVINADTGEMFQSDTGEEVYGRITQPGEMEWDIEFFSNEAGTETAYTFALDSNFLCTVNYRFEFKDLPTDGPLLIDDVFPADDPLGIRQQVISEALNVTTINTLPDLTDPPSDPNAIHLFINGMDEQIRDGAYSISGSTITWNAVAAGYDVEPTDTIVVEYTVNQQPAEGMPMAF